MQVSYAPTLRFSWSPACGMSSLSVTEVRDPLSSFMNVVWAFNVPENAPVGPGILYGSAPRNATVWAGPQALEVGTQYEVTVLYTVGGDVVSARGSAVFTWYPLD